MPLYLIINRINGKGYIGQTIGDLRERWVKHLSDARLGKGRVIGAAIRKHGAESFEIQELNPTVDIDVLNRLEAEHIVRHGTLVPHGYNLASGGKNHRAHPLTIEKCRRASMGNKNTLGYKASADTRKRQSDAHRGKKLKPHSEDTKRKIRAKAIGNKRCEGRKQTDAAKLKISSKKTRAEFDTDKMCELYSTGMTLDAIGEQLGCCGGTVRLRLIKVGVDRRPAAAPKGIYSEHLRKNNELRQSA